MKWDVRIYTEKGSFQLSSKGYDTKREAMKMAALAERHPETKRTEVTPFNKTPRETYSRIIGYNFGTDKEGNDCIYNGAYWDTDTGKKQYEFLYYDRSGKLVSQYLTDYKGFREIIDGYDWPRK